MLPQGTSAVQTILLLPVFFTFESTRIALWASRAVYEPDREGGLLRALFAFLIGVLGALPSPVWTVVMYVLYVVWLPVRAVLWVWGIGRGTSEKKRSPTAVTRWYTRTREPRSAETFRRRRKL